MGLWNGKPFAMRIGVCKRSFQTLPAEHNDKTMALACFDDDFGVTNLFDVLSKQGAELFADGSIDASGAAINNDAFVIQRAKIGAGGDVFLIGKKAVITSKPAGRLGLAVNDNKHWQNNIGTFWVTMTSPNQRCRPD